MVELRTVLLFVGVLAFGMFILEKSKPATTWKWWRIGIIAILTSSLWFWYERFMPLLKTSPQFGTLGILALIGFFVWLILGVYRSRSPIDT